MRKFLRVVVAPIIIGAFPYFLIYGIKDYISASGILKFLTFLASTLAVSAIFWLTGCLLLLIFRYRIKDEDDGKN